MLNKEQSMKEFLGAKGELHTAVTKFFALSEQEQQPKLTSIEEMPRPNLNLLTYVFPHILRLSADDYGTHSGVNFEELEFAKIRQFAKDLSITFPIVLSGGQPISGFDLKGLPTTFLVSPKGELADTHLGTVNAVMLKQRIIELEKTSDLPR